MVRTRSGKNMSTESQELQISEQEHTNIKLIQEYCDRCEAIVNRSIDISVAKLSFIFGLTTCLVSFPTVQSTNNLVLSANIASTVLSAVTLCFCFAGFRPQEGGRMAKPDVMLNEHYYDSEEDFRLILVKTQLEGFEGLLELRNYRAKAVGLALLMLCGAMLCKAIAWVGFNLLIFN